MANGNSGWISPRQRHSPPKRGRVAELRQKFETQSDKTPGHRKHGASHDRSRRSDYSQGYGGYDRYNSNYRSRQNYDSPEKSQSPKTKTSSPKKNKTLHSTLNRRGQNNTRGSTATNNFDDESDYSKHNFSEFLDDDIWNFKEHEPSFSTVLQSTRMDGIEFDQPVDYDEPTGLGFFGGRTNSDFEESDYSLSDLLDVDEDKDPSSFNDLQPPRTDEVELDQPVDDIELDQPAYDVELDQPADDVELDQPVDDVELDQPYEEPPAEEVLDQPVDYEEPPGVTFADEMENKKTEKKTKKKQKAEKPKHWIEGALFHATNVGLDSMGFRVAIRIGLPALMKAYKK